MNLEHLASILTATFSAKTTSDLTLAFMQLTELSASTEPFLLGLLELGVSNDANIKNSALTNFRNFLANALAHNQVTPTFRGTLFPKLVDLLIRPDLGNNQKETVAAALLIIVSTDNPDTYVNYFALIGGIAIQYLSGSAAHIQGGLLLAKVILINFMNHYAISPFLQQLMPPFIQTADKAIQDFISAVNSQDVQQAEEVAGIMLDWARVVSTIFYTWDNTSSKLVTQLANFDLANLFQRLLILKAVSSQEESQILVSFDNSSISIKLAEMKAHVLEMLTVVLQHLIDNKKQNLEKQGHIENTMVIVGSTLPDSPYVSLIQLLIQPLCLTLIHICNDSSVFEAEHIQKFVFQAFSLLQKSSNENRFYALFQLNYRELVIHCLIPCLCSNEEDLKLFEDSPDEFVSLGEEICEIQEKETVKSRAAHLLETICEFIDGCLVFTVSALYEMLSLSWDESHLPTLSQLSGASVLKLPKALLIDVALLSLSVLSYDVCFRKDLKAELERILELFFKSLESLQSDLIRTRFCLMLKYYSENLYLYEQGHKFNYLVQYLLNCLESRCPSVSLQASTTLNHIMIEEELTYRVEDLSFDIMECYSNLIPKMHNKAFFESLEEIVVKFPKQTTMLVNELASSLVTRILHEVPDSASHKDSIVLNKSLNVIRELVNSVDLDKSQLGVLEQNLEGLLMLLENPKAISFEDDLLNLQITFIKKTQSVSSIGWKVFACMPGVFEKYQGQLLHLFSLVNAYLVYGASSFSTNPQFLKVILDMCQITLSVAPNGKESESANSEAALIYQLMLHVFRDSMDEFLDSILSNTLVRYSTAKSAFFKARLLGVVLSAFSYNALLTMRIMSSTQHSEGMSYLKYILFEIFGNSQCFIQAYDKRVSVVGLCSLLMQDSLAPEVSENLNGIFEILITILSQSKEEPRLQAAVLSQLQATFEASDSDDDTFTQLTQYTKSQLSQTFDNEEGQANLSLVKLMTPLQQVDEYQHFKSILNGIRKRSPEALARLIAPLSAEHKQQLETIVISERVKINQLAGENTAVRKKVKAKKRVKAF
mmetsp:Transcript_18956/g.34321  ORF Transcript_18956/g.34321 Transcript_18956/m.34321 type:complete len:1053 (+) Transcript_18956:1737-4895(+)